MNKTFILLVGMAAIALLATGCCDECNKTTTPKPTPEPTPVPRFEMITEKQDLGDWVFCKTIRDKHTGDEFLITYRGNYSNGAVVVTKMTASGH